MEKWDTRNVLRRQLSQPVHNPQRMKTVAITILRQIASGLYETFKVYVDSGLNCFLAVDQSYVDARSLCDVKIVKLEAPKHISSIERECSLCWVC
jgi:hypothetical protein